MKPRATSGAGKRTWRSPVKDRVDTRFPFTAHTCPLGHTEGARPGNLPGLAPSSMRRSADRRHQGLLGHEALLLAGKHDEDDADDHRDEAKDADDSGPHE